MPTRRNPVVRTGTILRKGGVHRESASGRRHQQRRALDAAVDDYFDESVDDESSSANPPDGRQSSSQTRYKENSQGRKGAPDALWHSDGFFGSSNHWWL